MIPEILKKHKLVPASLVVMILVIITYAGTLKNSFVSWDDYAYVIDNKLVRSNDRHVISEIFKTPVALNYHPLTILSLRMNRNECKECPEGISPRPFIEGNIILHLLNSLLVLFFVYMLTGRNIVASLLVAIIFGVHPMHVESVAWISARKDVLYSFFFLSGLVAYLFYKARNDGPSKYLWLSASFIMFILSCLSKATAVVFPVVLLLTDFWFSYSEGQSLQINLKKVFSLKNLILLLPFFIVSVLFGIMAFRIQNNENFLNMLNPDSKAEDVVNIIQPFTVIQRFQVAAYGLVMYVIRFLAPVGLLAFYPYPEPAAFTQGSFAAILWMSLAATIILAAVIIWSAKRTKLFAFGTGFFLVTIMLVLQFVSVGKAMMADRYSYIPYIGLSLIPAVMIAGSSGRRRNILLVISGVFIAFLIFHSVKQAGTWKNTDTLWTNVIRKHPDLELARRSRGKYYSRMSGETVNEKAKKSLEDKALEDFSAAIRAGTKSADVYQGTAIILNSRNEASKALLFINKAIMMDPWKGGLFYNRAMIYDNLNEKDAAIEDYTRALNLNPAMAREVLSNRSVLYLETARYDNARKDLDLLISIDGNNHMYYFNRGFAKLQLGDISGAINDYRTVLKLKPDDEVTRAQLRVLLDNQKLPVKP